MGTNVKKGGFSIVEIMVSLLLVSIALITIAFVFPKIAGHKKNIREVDEAHAIAMESLEKLQRQSETTPFTSSTTGSFPSVTKTSGNVNYDISYDINISSYLKTAIVTVTWTKSGKTHNIRLAGAVR